MDEVLAEEGDIEDEAVTENVERCQEVLMLLEESLFNIEDFEEEIKKRRGEEILEQQQGAAVNVVLDTGEQGCSSSRTGKCFSVKLLIIQGERYRKSFQGRFKQEGSGGSSRRKKIGL